MRRALLQVKPARAHTHESAKLNTKLTSGTYRYSSRSSLISQQCKHPSHLHICISNFHHQSIQMTRTTQHLERLGPHLEDETQMLDTTAPSLGMCLALKEAVILTQVPRLLKKCRGGRIFQHGMAK